jgi:AraC family transcriptional regulator of adaptative response / methylphosphotriester-DNA alkyltransferase methyltransferase
MATKIPQKILARQHEITADFLKEIDKHLADIMAHKVMDMYEIRDIAGIMHIHPTHLSNTIKLTTGRAPCYFFEAKIMDIARGLLRDTSMPIAEIASTLTFDPSNFTKFFKRFEGVTPKQYREAILLEKYASNSETVTIKTETVTI